MAFIVFDLQPFEGCYFYCLHSTLVSVHQMFQIRKNVLHCWCVWGVCVSNYICVCFGIHEAPSCLLYMSNQNQKLSKQINTEKDKHIHRSELIMKAESCVQLEGHCTGVVSMPVHAAYVII